MRVGFTLTASFPDGTSTTIAVAERYARCNQTGTWQPDGYRILRFYEGNKVYVSIATNPTDRRPTFADPDYDDVQPVTTNGSLSHRSQGERSGRSNHPTFFVHRICLRLHTWAACSRHISTVAIRITNPSVSPEVFWAADTPAVAAKP